jgi:hypothetical protein
MHSEQMPAVMHKTQEAGQWGGNNILMRCESLARGNYQACEA